MKKTFILLLVGLYALPALVSGQNIIVHMEWPDQNTTQSDVVVPKSSVYTYNGVSVDGHFTITPDTSNVSAFSNFPWNFLGSGTFQPKDTISNLAPETPYWYRYEARDRSNGQIVYGCWIDVMTLAGSGDPTTPNTPTILSLSASKLKSTSAQINFSVESSGTTTIEGFLSENSSTAVRLFTYTLFAGSQDYAFNAGNLSAGTDYYLKLIVSNDGGVMESEIPFTTASATTGISNNGLVADAISSEELKNSTWSIYALDGKVLKTGFSNNLVVGENVLSDLPAGMYVSHIISESGEVISVQKMFWTK